jgi:hypothetical protein
MTRHRYGATYVSEYKRGNVSSSMLILIVATKFFAALDVGIYASSLCINRRIYHVAMAQHALHPDSSVGLIMGLLRPI